MGVKGLLQFLRKKYPSCIYRMPLDVFHGKRIAIDTSVYLYNFISRHNRNQTNWIDLFIELVLYFRVKNIDIVFVFDGKAPKEKLETKEKRNQQKNKIYEKIKRIEYYIERLETCQENEKTDAVLSNDDITEISTLVKQVVDTIQCQDIDNLLSTLKSSYYRLKGQCIHITQEHYTIAKSLFDGLGVNYIQAPDEAERYCAFLCNCDHVQAVLTIDSDILVYQTPVFINGTQINEEDVEIICYADVLKEMEFTPEQFRDFCIMCGTDYNDNIPKVGNVKSFDTIQKYKRIEHIPFETDILHYKRTRQLFTIDDLEQNDELYKTIYHKKKIDTDLLSTILMKHASSYTINDIEKMVFHPHFVIIH